MTEMLIQGFNNYVAAPLQSVKTNYIANAPLWLQDLVVGAGTVLNDVNLRFPQKLSLKPVSTVGQFLKHHKVGGLKAVRKYAHQGAKVAKYLSPFQTFTTISFHLSELVQPIEAAQKALKRKVVCEWDGKDREGAVTLSQNWLLLKKVSCLFSFAYFLGGFVYREGSSSLLGRAYPWVGVAAGFGMGAQAIWEEYTVCTSQGVVPQGGDAPLTKDIASKEWWYSMLGIVNGLAICVIQSVGAGILYYEGHVTLESARVVLTMGSVGLAGGHYLAGAYMSAWRDRVAPSTKA